MLPRVSCVVLTYNAEQRIERCLRSVLASDYPQLEVIVVDNASSDRTVQIVERFPGVRLIRNSSNLGFAAGNNIGIRAATGEHLLLLNDDTTVDRECVRVLAEAAVKDHRAGVLGGKIYNGGTRVIQSAGGRILDSGGTPVIGHGQLDKGQFDTERDVDYVVGAAFLISGRALNEVGLLSEAYFFYGEEVEYCLRVRRAGLRVTFIPGAKVEHFVGSFAGRQTYQRYYNACRSRLVFAFRNFEGIHIVKFIGYELILGPSGLVLGLRVSGGWRYLPVYWRATFNGYRWFASHARSIIATKRFLPTLA